MNQIESVKRVPSISNSVSSRSKDSFSTNDTSETTNRERVLGTFSGMCMNVNNMIGSGIFSATGDIWFLTGSGGMTLIFYVIGFLFSLVGSLIYVELGSSIPESGGEQRYLERSFPRPRLIIGYLFSFSMITLMRPGNIASDVIVASEYILYAGNGNFTVNYAKNATILHPDSYANNQYWEIRILAFALLTIVTFYHLFSNNMAVKINQALAAVKTVTLLIISIIGLTKISKYSNRLDLNLLFRDTRGWDNIGSFSSAMLKVLFAYEGWNNLNYTLDEMKNPTQKLKISNPASVVLVGILYILAVLSIIVVVEPSAGHEGSYNQVISAQLGNEIGLGKLVSILIAVSSIGAVGSMVWSGSRIIAAAASANYIPFFSPMLLKYHEGYKTPFNALIAQWSYCSLIIFFFPSNNPYDALVNMTQYSALIFYGLSALGLLVLRRTEKNLYRPFKIDKKLVYTFIIVSVFIYIGAFIPPPPQISNTLKYLNPPCIPYLLSYLFIFIGVMCWVIYYYRQIIFKLTHTLNDDQTSIPEMGHV